MTHTDLSQDGEVPSRGDRNEPDGLAGRTSPDQSTGQPADSGLTTAQIARTGDPAPEPGPSSAPADQPVDQPAGPSAQFAAPTEPGAAPTEPGAAPTESGATLTEHGATLTEHGATLTEHESASTEHGAIPTEQGAAPIGHAAGQSAADGQHSRMPLLAQEELEGLITRWRDIQAGFVDEPRRAVKDADTLVADLMQRLAQMFAAEREELESRWTAGDDVSTEDLRQGLRRYRSFFERLLAA